MRHAENRSQAERLQMFLDSARASKNRYETKLNRPGLLPGETESLRKLISLADTEIKTLEQKLAAIKE